MEYVLSIFCHPLYVPLLWETEGGKFYSITKGGGRRSNRGHQKKRNRTGFAESKK